MNEFETSFIYQHYFDDMENWCWVRNAYTKTRIRLTYLLWMQFNKKNLTNTHNEVEYVEKKKIL